MSSVITGYGFGGLSKGAAERGRRREQMLSFISSCAASAHLDQSHARCSPVKLSTRDVCPNPPPNSWRASNVGLPHPGRPDVVCSSRMGRDFQIAESAWQSCRLFSLRTSSASDWASLGADAARGSRRISPLKSSAEGFVAENVEVNEDVVVSILKLSLPALGIVVADPLMSLIDTGCVGQLSSIQLAALGPNTLIFNFVFQVFGFLGTTTCNFMASTNIKATSPRGQRELDMRASRLLSQALCLAAILGIAMTGLMKTFAPQLLLLMGAGPDYLKPALTYLHIRALSVPAVLILLVGQGALLGRQNASAPLFINLVAASLNLAGDLLFTLWAAWGVAGAAWATVAAQYVAVFLLFRALKAKAQESKSGSWENSEEESVALFSPKPAALEIGWFGLPSLDVLRPLFSMAAPLIVRCVLSMVVYTSIGKVAAQLGTLPIAAHQVAMQVFWFLSYFPESLSVSAQSLIASDLKSNPKRAHAVARMLLLLSLGLGLGLSLTVAAIHIFGISWLTADEKVASLVISVTKQSMICELLGAVAVVIEGIAIASGDLAYLSRMQMMILGVMLFALISTYRAGGGLSGVWWCLVISYGSRVAYHIIHIGSHWHSHVLGAAPSQLYAM